MVTLPRDDTMAPSGRSRGGVHTGCCGKILMQPGQLHTSRRGNISLQPGQHLNTTSQTPKTTPAGQTPKKTPAGQTPKKTPVGQTPKKTLVGQTYRQPAAKRLKAIAAPSAAPKKKHHWQPGSEWLYTELCRYH